MSIENVSVIDKIKKLILSACVESFGIKHQVLYIEFRNDEPRDFTIQIECSIVLNGAFKSLSELSPIENFLLFMARCNLLEVVAVELIDNNNLSVTFSNDFEFRVINTNDMDEPWSFFSSDMSQEYSISIIAIESTGFAMWEK